MVASKAFFFVLVKETEIHYKHYADVSAGLTSVVIILYLLKSI